MAISMNYRKIDRVIEEALYNARFLEREEDKLELALKAGFREVTKQIEEENAEG